MAQLTTYRFGSIGARMRAGRVSGCNCLQVAVSYSCSCLQVAAAYAQQPRTLLVPSMRCSGAAVQWPLLRQVYRLHQLRRGDEGWVRCLPAAADCLELSVASQIWLFEQVPGWDSSNQSTFKGVLYFSAASSAEM